jgi:Tol biopolymer transport system component
MIKYIGFLIILLHLQIDTVNAQENLFKYPDPVLPDSVPRIFAPGLISLSDSHEEGICFSPDGMEIFFTRKDTVDDKYRSVIYHQKRTNQAWSPVRSASFTTNANDSQPAFSGDGQTLYFFSERRKPGITSYIGEIWLSTKNRGNWNKPVYPENILNETWITSVSSTKEGRLYFSSYRNKQIGIFYSEKIKGIYQDPVYLPKEINSIAGASNPFITPDDSIIVFEGKPTGYDYTELYISFKTSKGIWEPAQKLNDSINHNKTETNPSISPDGKYLFFTRDGDIYWVRLEYVF